MKFFFIILNFLFNYFIIFLISLFLWNWIWFCMSEAEKLEPFEWQLGCRRSSPPRWCRGSKLGDLSPTTRAVPAAPRVGAPASVPISLLPFCGLAWRRSKAAAALASRPQSSCGVPAAGGPPASSRLCAFWVPLLRRSRAPTKNKGREILEREKY